MAFKLETQGGLGSWKMIPCPAVHDVPDKPGGDAKASNQFLVWHTLPSKFLYLYHLGLGEFRSAVPFASGDWRWRVSSLVSHVFGVLRICPKEKVIRSNARRIVAFMTDEHAIRDYSVGQLPRKPMRPVVAFAEPFSFSVPVFILVAGPFPALLRFLDSVPKLKSSLFKRRNRTWMHEKSPVVKRPQILARFSGFTGELYV